MCICNCIHSQEVRAPVRAREARPRLFQLMTVVLLTGWILVVAVAANIAKPEDAPKSPTLQTFIKEML